MITVELEKTDGEIITVCKFTELCFTQTAGVPCDSLWAYYAPESETSPEISRVRAYENGELIFSGLCDCSKRICDENGARNYFYARSSACVLVDNEAEPLTYNKPSAAQLCFTNAAEYGFTHSLPDIYSEMQYEVAKGTSRYGAINSFVYLTTGSRIAVTPENEIILQTPSDGIETLGGDVISAVYTVNRSEPYSQILFKKTYSSQGYNMHTRSDLAANEGIERTVYVNLSALPEWQREKAVLQKLNDSFENYRVLEIKKAGIFAAKLMQRYNYGEYGDYVLTEIKYTVGGDGAFTRLTLKKSVDVKEITYVD